MIDWHLTETIDERCPACGLGGRMSVVASVPRIDAPQERARFARCGACASLLHDGAIRAFDHVTGADQGTFLRQYLENLAGPWEMFWPIGVLADAGRRSLLEVGCGFGWSVDLWRTQVNADAHGCDPADYARAGRALLGEHIHHALLDDVPELAGRRFDVVYASEVIEHVDDPRAFVGLLVPRLTPRGVLVLTTPAAEFIAPENDPATVLAALAPGFHGMLFSRGALEALLREFGFPHVVVERHHERLIAWASAEPIARRAPEALLSAYLRYLAERGRTVTGEDEVSRSLRAGLAYRNFKERLLRGVSEGLEAARSEANRIALMTDEAQAPMPEALLSALRETAAGLPAFAKRFRFCLPQVAFLNGIDAQRLGQRDLAQRWFALMQAVTERLCGQSVLYNLEAAAWYWIAERERLIALAEAGDDQGLAQGLLQLFAALDVPLARIGGSSPSGQSVFDVLVLLADGHRSAEYGRFLARVAAHLEAASAPVAHWAAALFALSAGRCTGQALAPALERCASAVEALEERSGSLKPLAQARLAADRAQPAALSFASGAWKQPLVTSRWG
ncbi:MAG: class I SAM-dependent methyltransferase [Casimicrobiaceae bacterium]|nr:class I SAM-dependent methyltransferase [Casimicrobiaceae bacterium]